MVTNNVVLSQKGLPSVAPTGVSPPGVERTSPTHYSSFGRTDFPEGVAARRQLAKKEWCGLTGGLYVRYFFGPHPYIIYRVCWTKAPVSPVRVNLTAPLYLIYRVC